ncbi:LexA family protein [Blautia marasmi]|uniref:LexA family protein n=1 Tax=Blautia marasmi TaxID=1917868 RepID=UPI000CF256B0|nr:hypothetical protein [Blautia marasmi]
MKAEDNIKRGERTRRDILEYIKQYIRQHSYPPCRREIGDGVGLKSTSSVQSHIDRMLADGMLETDDEAGTPRALRVPGMQIVSREMTVLDRYIESERVRIVEQLCPYDIPWLVHEAGTQQFEGRQCQNDCEKCWNVRLVKAP